MRVFTLYWIFSILTRSNVLLVIDQWDRHVYSEAFDRDCNAQSRRFASNSSGSESYDHLKLWESDDASSLTWVDPSEHGVSKLEAYIYYHGLRGDRKPGPKLIYRTSKDIFSPPSGPSWQDLRFSSFDAAPRRP